MPTEVIASAPRAQRGAFEFPACPASWHYLAPVDQLSHGPVQVDLHGSGSFVGYRSDTGRFVVMNNRCSHVGSNLALGHVRGENLVCPLHGWEFGPNGHCVAIPAGDAVPKWARQCTYPVHEIAGHLFFFNQPVARFPMPFFPGVDPNSLTAAEPFDLFVDAPWYIASSNGFDLQHFRCAHDRVLMGDPVIEAPHSHARSISGRFKVAGSSWRDVLTRRFSGTQVKMTITDWAGNLIFTTAHFARTTTYGMLVAEPLANDRTRARVIVFVERSRSALLRRTLDHWNAAIRRNFIRAFLEPDVERTAGLHYHPGRLIESDRTLREYLEWLEQLHRSKGTQ